jgi:hypothetical protein
MIKRAIKRDPMGGIFNMNGRDEKWEHSFNRKIWKENVG